MSDVREWLESLGLGQYVDAFNENAVSWDTLPELDHDLLKEIGVKAVGHRVTILKAVQSLDREGSPPIEANAVPPHTEQLNAAERRQLTVMFCDLVGSTRLSQRLDPEDLREVNRRYQDAAKAAIEHFAGYIARYMGDGVLAYFGYPRAHEDDAERAVRAGLAIVEAMPALSAKLARTSDVEFAVRVGIATGPVVVGDLIGEGASQESAVVGETPNLAARLQGVAAPNTVVVAPSTMRLSARSLEYVEEGEHGLAGFVDPVAIWRAVVPRPESHALEGDRAFERAPLIGREPEVGLLFDRWQRAKAGEGQVVLIGGEAGIGKTRLLREFQSQIAAELRNRVLYFCSPYHEQSAFYPARDQLSRGFRFVSDDDVARKLDKIEGGLRTLGLPVHEIAPLLASLDTIPTGGRYPDSRLSPERLRQRLMEAIVTVTEAMAARHPVLQVVEDVHWADPSTLELLGHMIERCRATAMLHVVTFRPDFAPPWLGGTNVTALTLSNLGKAESETIMDRLAGQRSLPDILRRRILERTDGVPLFVEELTRSVLESSALMDIDGRLTLDGQSAEPDIPESIQDSLMARVDRLPGERDVLQLAAVIGRQFDHDLLLAISEHGELALGSKLGRLIDAGLVHRLRAPPHGTYEFHHALVQEAAYASLLRARRRILHAKVATVVQERFPETAQGHPELVARHCALGGLHKDAVELWRRAGEIAMERAAHQEAVACFEAALTALDELKDTSEKLQQGIELRLCLRAGLFGTGELTRMYAYLGEAEKLATRLGDERQIADININMAWAQGFQGNLDAAIESAKRARAMAEGLRDQPLQALADSALVWLYGSHVGLPRQAVRHCESAMAILSPDLLHTRLGQTGVRSVFVLSNVALARASLGEFVEAIEAGERAIAIAREVDHPYDLSYAEWCLGSAFLTQGELANAVAHLDAAYQSSQANGIRVVEAWALGELGCARLLEGNAADALSTIEQAMALARRTGIRRQVVVLTAYLAEAHRRTGSVEVARSLAADALDACRLHGFRFLEPAALRVRGLVEMESDGSDMSVALSWCQESVATAEARGFRPEMAHGHLALASVNRELGRNAKAACERSLAADLFRSMRMTYWTREAQIMGIPKPE